MNQYVAFKFVLQKENKNLYVFECLPGSPWAEIEEAIDEIKSELLKLKADALAQEAAKAQPAPEPQEVKAELVS